MSIMKIDLKPVITWLENGCRVSDAIEELKIYQRSLEANSCRITSLGITRAASFWYPTMLTQESGEISESKAAELLGLNIEDYREKKYNAIKVVLYLIEHLPSPFVSIMEVIRENPEFFND